MNDFSSLRDAAEAVLPPSPLPVLPVELCLHLHQQLIDEERTLDRQGQIRSRRVVVGPGKHFCASKGLDGLAGVDLSGGKGGLRCNEIGKGKMLICRVRTNCVRRAGVHLVVEDVGGRVAPVIIHHVPLAHSEKDLNEQYPKGSYFAIREPSIRESRDGFLIRIDSPSDFHPLLPTSPLLRDLKWSTSPSIPPAILTSTQYKDRGNVFFGKKQFQLALEAYSAGIDALLPSEIAQKIDALLRSNRAATLLKLDRPGAALEDCNAASTLEWILSKDSATIFDKLQYRTAVAEYQLQHFQNAIKRLASLLQVKGDSVDSEVTALYRRATLRGEEANTGKYDWRTLYRESLTNKTLDVADYSIPSISIRAIPGRGRGLVATADIAEGELLLVAKPLAIGFGDATRKSYIVPANLYTETIDPYALYDLVSLLIVRMEDEPGLRSKVADLYAGSAFPTSVNEIGDDTSRLEAIATFNAFHTESLAEKTTVLSVEDATSADIHARSSLYHLPSYLNHACIGNVTYSFLSDVIFIRARRNIKKGEELLDSYVDSLEGLSKRMEKISKHGFTCGCQLCFYDRMDGLDICQDRERIAMELGELTDKIHGTKTEEGNAHLDEIRSFVKRMEETYAKSRPKLRPASYSALRLLAQTLAGMGNRKEAIETEVAALEALGAVFAGSDFVEVPKVGDVNAVRSALFVAMQYQVLGKKQLSQQWIANAKRIEAGQAGTDLFVLRYEEWARRNGLELKEDVTPEL